MVEKRGAVSRWQSPRLPGWPALPASISSHRISSHRIASQVRTAVEYIVREGISVPLPELGQQLVAREMLQILSEVAGSAPPASGFAPLYNEHQIQAREGRVGCCFVVVVDGISSWLADAILRSSVAIQQHRVHVARCYRRSRAVPNAARHQSLDTDDHSRRLSCLPQRPSRPTWFCCTCLKYCYRPDA